MTKYYSIITLSLFCMHASAMEGEPHAGLGFENMEVLALLEAKAEENGARVADLIEAAQEKIHKEDMVRFYVTVEGELFLWGGNHQLYAVVPVKAIGLSKPEVLVCLCDVEALLQRTEGVLHYTDDIFGEDALQDDFDFLRAEDPELEMQEFVDEYYEARPDLKKAQKKLKWLYGAKNGAQEAATKRARKHGDDDDM